MQGAWLRLRISKDGADHQGRGCVVIVCLPIVVSMLVRSKACSSNFEHVEGRLSSVERLLRGLAGRVVRLEDSDGFDTPVRGRALGAHRPDYSAACDNPCSEVNTYDPTDGIGSIVFTQEEDTGYFGSYHLFFLFPQQKLSVGG